jgi:hypothetical protein
MLNGRSSSRLAAWTNKYRRQLALAAALTVATLLVLFLRPSRSSAPHRTFVVLRGGATWAAVDLRRHAAAIRLPISLQATYEVGRCWKRGQLAHSRHASDHQRQILQAQVINNTETVWQVPSNPRGVLLVAHGCNHGAIDWWPLHASRCKTCIGEGTSEHQHATAGSHL